MRTEQSKPPIVPVTPFERYLIYKHKLPDHWARTFAELRGGHR